MDDIIHLIILHLYANNAGKHVHMHTSAHILKECSRRTVVINYAGKGGRDAPQEITTAAAALLQYRRLRRVYLVVPYERSYLRIVVVVARVQMVYHLRQLRDLLRHLVM
jgi:hypothetical protein